MKKIKVPYFKQTTEATCGPSCLMMVFNYYDPKFSINRKREWEIWRKATMLVWPASSPLSLANAALNYGFRVTLFRERKAIWRDTDFIENNPHLKYLHNSLERETKKLGLKIIRKKINLEFLKQQLKKGIPPIVLTCLIKKNGEIDFAHWVVITAVDDKNVIMNDPYFHKDRKISIRLFEKAWEHMLRLPNNLTKEVLLIEPIK